MSQNLHKIILRTCSVTWRRLRKIVLASLLGAAVCGCWKQTTVAPIAGELIPSTTVAAETHALQQTTADSSSEGPNSQAIPRQANRLTTKSSAVDHGDCNFAKNSVERLICASHKLAALDGDLKQLFYKIEAETRGVDGETGQTVDPFGDEQRFWVSHVRSHCSSETCLEMVYKRRIDMVKRQWSSAL